MYFFLLFLCLLQAIVTQSKQHINTHNCKKKNNKKKCLDKRQELSKKGLQLLPKLCELFVGMVLADSMKARKKEKWNENKQNQDKLFDAILKSIVNLFKGLENPSCEEYTNQAQETIGDLIEIVANVFDARKSEYIRGLLAHCGAYVFFFVCFYFYFWVLLLLFASMFYHVFAITFVFCVLCKKNETKTKN